MKLLDKACCTKLRSFTAYKYLKELLVRYAEDDLAAMSAQVTYYVIMAFFPFLFFLINLLSFTPLPQQLLLTNLNILLPSDTALLVKQIIAETMQAKSTTILLLGMLGSLWATSKGMAAIIRGLNHSYGVKESRGFIKLNLIALIAIIALSGMVIFSFVLIVLGRMIGSHVFGLMGAKALFYSIWSFVRYGISLSLMLVTFYILYTYLPSKRLKPKDIIIGTIFSTLGWVACSVLFAFYVNNFGNYALFYGSLGGVFALILWLYMSNLIILLGGELNAISRKFEDEGNSRCQ